MSKRKLWHTAIVIAGFGYIVLALSINIQSPIFAVLFVIIAGYELVESYTGRHKT